ncbi:MAG: family 10 glycosylhydrolase, partial [Candidatus Cloacimonetes bacterium]|nr:family 10 glycosylhydrolase [Candidatus Cloacimonadota bacterium]
KENGEMISWNEWRIRQVTEFVSKCSIRVKSINPNLMLSTAVLSNISEARISYAQDWYDWLKKGIVDRVYPMAYHLDYNVFSNQLDEMLYYGLEQNLVIGLRAWNANGKSLMPKDNPEYNLEHIIKRINRIREGKFGGIALFSYHSITQNGALDSLALLSYPPIENKLPIEPMYTEENAADVKVNLVAGTYVIEIMLPKEGKWFWSISDTNNTLIYNKQRFYFKGLNQEFWNGILINGTYIAPGNYIFTVFHEDANYKYMIPISLDSIVHE